MRGRSRQHSPKAEPRRHRQSAWDAEEQQQRGSHEDHANRGEERRSRRHDGPEANGRARDERQARGGKGSQFDLADMCSIVSFFMAVMFFTVSCFLSDLCFTRYRIPKPDPVRMLPTATIVAGIAITLGICAPSAGFDFCFALLDPEGPPMLDSEGPQSPPLLNFSIKWSVTRATRGVRRALRVLQEF